MKYCRSRNGEERQGKAPKSPEPSGRVPGAIAVSLLTGMSWSVSKTDLRVLEKNETRQCCERGGLVTSDFSLLPRRAKSEGFDSPLDFAGWGAPTETGGGVSNARTA